jgi:hypothetical protein
MKGPLDDAKQRVLEAIHRRIKEAKSEAQS